MRFFHALRRNGALCSSELSNCWHEHIEASEYRDTWDKDQYLYFDMHFHEPKISGKSVLGKIIDIIVTKSCADSIIAPANIDLYLHFTASY